MIIVSKMHRRFGKVPIEEVSLQTFPKYSRWRRHGDILWKNVPQPVTGTARLACNVV